jgi:hypothetical protein
MWAELSIAPIELRAAEINDVVDTFRSIYVQGGAEFACFQLSEPPLLGWILGRQQIWATNCDAPNAVDFCGKFLVQPPVRAHLSILQIPSSLPEPFHVEWSDSFILDGLIARQLRNGGGPRGRFRGSPSLAKEMAVAFCRSLFDDRFDDVEVYASYSAWSPWFRQIPYWNRTWFVIDRSLRRCSVLALTEND